MAVGGYLAERPSFHQAKEGPAEGASDRLQAPKSADALEGVGVEEGQATLPFPCQATEMEIYQELSWLLYHRLACQRTVQTLAGSRCDVQGGEAVVAGAMPRDSGSCF